MIRKIKNTAMKILLAGALLVGGLANAEDKKPSPGANLSLTEIVARDQKPLSRAESLVKNLPLNSDLYATVESKTDKQSYKVRAQTFPLKFGPLSAGLTAQHTEGTGLESREDAGYALRIAGKPIKGLFLKADTRYFHNLNNLEGYAIADSSRIATDLLWKYDTETGKVFARPGIDYKLFNGKRFSISLRGEGAFSGKLNDLDQTYIGAGFKAGINF